MGDPLSLPKTSSPPSDISDISSEDEKTMWVVGELPLTPEFSLESKYSILDVEGASKSIWFKLGLKSSETLFLSLGIDSSFLGENQIFSQGSSSSKLVERESGGLSESGNLPVTKTITPATP